MALSLDSFMGEIVVPVPGDGDSRRITERCVCVMTHPPLTSLIIS